jgi:hypothetical protein
MVLDIEDADRLFTEKEFEMLNQAYWGHHVSDRRRKAASSMVRSLLSRFDVWSLHGSDEERKHHRQLILDGFLCVFPYRFRDSFFEHITDEDPGPAPKKPSEQIHTLC